MAGRPSGRLKSAQTLPRTPRGADEGMRLELAARGREDFYFFTKGILGYDLLTPHTHGALCRFLQNCDAKRRMVQMPRDHFKTTIATISHSMWLAVNDPEVRILLVASSSKNAERFLAEIRNHFKNNERFRWLYPEIVPQDWSKTRSNAQELEIPRRSHWREPTFDTIGARGAVESRHYNWIKADDIIGLKEFESDAEMDKTIEWTDGLEALLVLPMKDRIDFIGTRWKLSDVYAHVERYYGGDTEPQSVGPHARRRGAIVIFNRGAREGGEPIFPELVSNEFLDRLMINNPERYAAQYANDPRAAGTTTFREEWLQYFHWVDEESHEPTITFRFREQVRTLRLRSMDIKVFTDPAVAENKKSSSRQALIVTAERALEGVLLIFVLQAKIGHYPPHELIDTIFEWDAEYHPDFVAVEKYGYQGSIKYWVHERAEQERLPYPPLLEFPPKGTLNNQKSKDERIRGLQPIFRNGQVFLHQTQGDLIEEYLFYPRGRYRDGLDCLAQGLVWWSHSWDEEAEDEWEEFEESILARLGPDGYSLRRGSDVSESRRLARLSREVPAKRLSSAGRARTHVRRGTHALSSEHGAQQTG